MNLEEVREYCLSLPQVTEDMPFSEEVLVFRIGGKIFLFLWMGERATREAVVAIKLPPDMGLDLRDKYEAVRPAFHMNKKHWNDVNTDNVDSELLKEWINTSYHLVCKKNRIKV